MTEALVKVWVLQPYEGLGWAQQGVVEWVLLLVKEQQVLVKEIVGVQLGLEWGTQLEAG